LIIINILILFVFDQCNDLPAENQQHFL